MITISQLASATAVAPGDLIPLTQGSTGPNTGTTRKATAALIRPSARLLLQWSGGAIVANGIGWFVAQAPYAGAINALSGLTGNGSFVANVQIGGVSVTGLSAVTINSGSLTTTNATGANTFAIGATITVLVTGATGSPTNALCELDVTWS